MYACLVRRLSALCGLLLIVTTPPWADQKPPLDRPANPTAGSAATDAWLKGDYDTKQQAE